MSQLISIYLFDCSVFMTKEFILYFIFGESFLNIFVLEIWNYLLAHEFVDECGHGGGLSVLNCVLNAIAAFSWVLESEWIMVDVAILNKDERNLLLIELSLHVWVKIFPICSYKLHFGFVKTRVGKFSVCVLEIIQQFIVLVLCFIDSHK